MSGRRRAATIGAVVATGLAVALVLAFFVSPHASSQPDGLEKVAADNRLDTRAQAQPGAGPLAHYSVQGVDDPSISTGVAGVIGVAVTFGVGLGLFVVLRAVRRRSQPMGGNGVAAAPEP
jgi:cobalt/nickel transport system permease protein